MSSESERDRRDMREKERERDERDERDRKGEWIFVRAVSPRRTCGINQKFRRPIDYVCIYVYTYVCVCYGQGIISIDDVTRARFIDTSRFYARGSTRCSSYLDFDRS